MTAGQWRLEWAGGRNKRRTPALEMAEKDSTDVAMIAIDGSTGEGGGQVLRTALTMSLVTGTPFRVDNIRAGRRKPGLMRQHLTAVIAAAEISDARVEGAELGSRALTFTPGRIKSGNYVFAVGTAGSATLVLQTVLAPLLLASGRSTLTLEGGTHNPWAPPFDFFDRVLTPLINRMGPTVTSSLTKYGFYPAGGGQFTVELQPCARLARLDLIERGEIVGRKATVMIANLPTHIAERELTTALRMLNWGDGAGSIEVITGAPGPGNIVMVETVAAHATEVCTGFGEMRTAAEAVATQAATEMRRYLVAGVPVGLHLADQLMPLMALGAGGSYRTLSLSRHATTNAGIVRQFVDMDITVTNESRDVVRVDIEKR